MDIERILLLMIIALSAATLFEDSVKRRSARELQILIMVQNFPQLAEGFVRSLAWNLTLLRGMRAEIGLIIDEPDDELVAVQTALVDEGLLEPGEIRDPDLVLVI